MYIRKYNNHKDFVKIGEYEIPLPTPPNDNDIFGYRLSEANQKFYRIEEPKGFNSLPTRDKYNFIEEQYSRRKNGYWIFLKGQRFYIPPTHFYFLHWWRTQEGYLPSFRIPNRDIFLFLDYTHRETKSLGSFVVKPRGVNWTDIVDCTLLERATRIRNSRHAMFHINAADNMKSFNRIVQAYAAQPTYMQPMKSGSNLDKEGIMSFERPPEVLTKKKLDAKFSIDKEVEDEEKGLISTITAYATTQVSGDSERFKTIFVDEFGKMGLKNTTRVDLLSKHDVLKYTLFVENGKRQIGKMHYGSTVEDETDEGLMVDQIREMWDNSNPNDRLPDGMTISGLYRLLIPASWAEPVDEYGMVDLAKFHAERSEKEKALLASGKIAELVRFRRKQCMTIEDALSLPSTQCVVDREKVESQLFRVQNPYDDNGKQIYHKGVRGNLVWKDGIKFGRVEWLPDPKGLWNMIRNEENTNSFRIQDGYKIPTNRLKYGGAIDPYDNKIEKATSKHSKGAMVIKRKFDAYIDDPNSPIQNWQTNQVAITYYHRHYDPIAFADDMLKTCIYYGTDVLIEKAKGTTIRKYFEDNGYIAYIQWVDPAYASKADLKDAGVSATENVIYEYVDLIKTEVSQYSELIYDEELLQQLRSFTNQKKNRSERDLVVAFGLALIAEHKNYTATIPQEEDDDSGVTQYLVQY
jgi:hypothetical protein